MTTVTGTQDLSGRGGGPGPVTQPIGAAAQPVGIADPAPLGLAGFGITTLVLSVINAGWINSGVTPIVLGLAVAYGGTAQFVAGMWAFRRGNTFAATAFTSYGAFWLSFWLIVAVFAAQVPHSAAAGIPGALGTYLLAWGIFTAYMFIASLASPKAVTLVFLLLALTFFALAIGNYTGNATTKWINVGGYLGLATAIVALYVSFADVTNANFKRIILPTF